MSSGHGSMGRQPPGGLVSETAFVKVKTQLHFGWSKPSRRRCSEHISLGVERMRKGASWQEVSSWCDSSLGSHMGLVSARLS